MQDEDRVFYIFKQEKMYAQNSMMLLVKNYDNSNFFSLKKKKINQSKSLDFPKGAHQNCRNHWQLRALHHSN